MKLTVILAALTLALFMPTSAHAKGVKATTFGGWNGDDVIDAAGLSHESGFAIGGSLGTSIDSIPGLGVEAEISFRQNEAQVSFCCGAIKADHDTWALMANARYDVPLGLVTLYPLVGAGYVNTQATFESIPLARIESAGFAWQMGAGADFEIADGVSFGARYVYFHGTDLTVFGTELSNGVNNSVLATATFRID